MEHVTIELTDGEQELFVQLRDRLAAGLHRPEMLWGDVVRYCINRELAANNFVERLQETNPESVAERYSTYDEVPTADESPSDLTPSVPTFQPAGAIVQLSDLEPVDTAEVDAGGTISAGEPEPKPPSEKSAAPSKAAVTRTRKSRGKSA